MSQHGALSHSLTQQMICLNQLRCQRTMFIGGKELGRRMGERAADAVSLQRGQMYLEHLPRVRAVIGRALRRAGQFSAANLADLVQETFLKSLSEAARRGYDAQRAYAPFLLTIARNVAIDWARSRTREARRTLLLENPESLFAAPKAERDPALVAMASSYAERLSPELEDVHRLRFVEGVPQRRAAELLGISRQNLRTLERRLIEGFKREVRSHGRWA